MTMVKVSKVPSGYYSAKEAIRRLGMSEATFHYQVKSGKITKLVPPGRKEGFYSKVEIEKLAQAQELFTLLLSVEPVIFQRASSEDDIRGIVDLCVAIYGVGGTPSYETRLSIWQKCPDAYYVVKQENIVVGYISLIWFKPDTLDYLMGQKQTQSVQTAAGNGVYSVTGPENVIPLIEGEPIESLFISIGVRPGMSLKQQRDYGSRLLSGTSGVLLDFARRGMPVHKLLATSEKADGISLARKLGMQEIKYSGDPLYRYALDLRTSNARLAIKYREFLACLSESES